MVRKDARARAQKNRSGKIFVWVGALMLKAAKKITSTSINSSQAKHEMAHNISTFFISISINRVYVKKRSRYRGINIEGLK